MQIVPILKKIKEECLPSFIESPIIIVHSLTEPHAAEIKSFFPQDRIIEISKLELSPSEVSFQSNGVLFLFAHPATAGNILDHVREILTPHGWVYVISESAKESFEEIVEYFRKNSFEPYLKWLMFSEFSCEQPPGETYLLKKCENWDTQESDACVYKILVFVRNDYDPLSHARALLLKGEPGLAHDVLSYIPSVYLDNPSIRAAVKAEQAATLLGWDQIANDGASLLRFYLAQAFFAQATAADPKCQLAYSVQAEFWHRLGDNDMAMRVIKTIEHVAPHSMLAEQQHRYSTIPSRQFSTPLPPEWDEKRFRPRILFFMDNRPNYGLDILYDGLVQVLGPDHVVDFPLKPTLHGHPADKFADYPCQFDYPDAQFSFDELLERIHQQYFDVFLFGDLEHTIPRETLLQLLDRGASIPVFVLDMLDDFRNNLAEVKEWLGIKHIKGYFKREMLKCVDYGSCTYPMPFAYPTGLVPSSLPEKRPYVLFWAGQRQFGIRKLALDYLERRFNTNFSERYPQQEYVHLLQHSRIGLDFSGFGFDTVRYWEVPAHGAMLLAERRPTHIPYNFVDKETAVFFDDLADLEQKIIYYGSNSALTSEIARKGHEHLSRYHTSDRRAQHLLGWMQWAMK